jgi:hypothetical protein
MRCTRPGGLKPVLARLATVPVEQQRRTTMTTKTRKTAAAKPKARQPGQAPAFRAWLVTDPADPADKAQWTEINPLWPTKTGLGFSGRLKKPLPPLAGRLVILPAHIGQPQ